MRFRRFDCHGADKGAQKVDVPDGNARRFDARFDCANADAGRSDATFDGTDANAARSNNEFSLAPPTPQRRRLSSRSSISSLQQFQRNHLYQRLRLTMVVGLGSLVRLELGLPIRIRVPRLRIRVW